MWFYVFGACPALSTAFPHKNGNHGKRVIKVENIRFKWKVVFYELSFTSGICWILMNNFGKAVGLV